MEVSTQWRASDAIMVSAASRLALGPPSERLLQETTSISGKGGCRRVLRGSGIDQETDAASRINVRWREAYPSLGPCQQGRHLTVPTATLGF